MDCAAKKKSISQHVRPARTKISFLYHRVGADSSLSFVAVYGSCLPQNAQQRLRTDCAFAQADLSFCWAYSSETLSPHVAKNWTRIMIDFIPNFFPFHSLHFQRCQKFQASVLTSEPHHDDKASFCTRDVRVDIMAKVIAFRDVTTSKKKKNRLGLLSTSVIQYLMCKSP